MDKLSVVIIALVLVLLYGLIGTSSLVGEIKIKAPESIEARGWDVVRYEGYQFGSFGYHGGKVWYHVKDKSNPSIQYRVFITMWGDELHYHYSEPEKLERIEITK